VHRASASIVLMLLPTVVLGVFGLRRLRRFPLV
jgi:hypothetical protein